jgi:hypothetical protein
MTGEDSTGPREKRLRASYGKIRRKPAPEEAGTGRFGGTVDAAKDSTGRSPGNRRVWPLTPPQREPVGETPCRRNAFHRHARTCSGIHEGGSAGADSRLDPRDKPGDDDVSANLSPLLKTPLHSPHLVRLRGAFARRREMRDGVRRPRVPFAMEHSGGAGTPPGSTTRPRLEQADDLSIALPASGLFERDGGVLRRSSLRGALRLSSTRSSSAKRGSAKKEGNTQAKARPGDRKICRDWRAARCPRALKARAKRICAFRRAIPLMPRGRAPGEKVRHTPRGKGLLPT